MPFVNTMGRRPYGSEDSYLYPHYVYRHIRLDTNVPFYIGLGRRTKRKHYRRAFETGKSRSEIWVNTFNITDVEVEIIYECETHLEAIEKEMEFIRMYKRKEDGGTLCNLTIGGEGVIGVKPTENSKMKSAQRAKNRCGDKHACSLLKESEVISIIQQYNNRIPIVELVHKHPHVSKHTIYAIFKNKNWKHLYHFIDKSIKWTAWDVMMYRKKDLIPDMISDYNKGIPIYKLVSKYNTDKISIDKIFKLMNVKPMSRRQRIKIIKNAV